MPIYEYSCRKCKAHVEVMQKVSDKPLTRHEKCGGKLEKEWSRTGFQFKGTGWYVTDYAAGKSEAKENKEKESKEKESAAPASKAEAKSEPKEKGGEKSKAEKSKASASGTSAS